MITMRRAPKTVRVPRGNKREAGLAVTVCFSLPKYTLKDKNGKSNRVGIFPSFSTRRLGSVIDKGPSKRRADFFALRLKLRSWGADVTRDKGKMV